MPVLYGVFLYMGASSLKGIQVRNYAAWLCSWHKKIYCDYDYLESSASFNLVAAEGALFLCN